ncbi:MAG: tetratricopeptide repeat protein, partial [Eggerthellaceae bacterium]|nr:tetratricopeptide repeat protein [Eggerthellaceae bacterium]
IAVLEDVAAQGDAQTENLPAGVQAFYCSDAVARFLTPLANLPEGTRLVRYSDAAFRARSLLCDLYCELEEPDRAIQQAKTCIDLAPTSTIGYTDLVNAFFLKSDYEQAIPYLKHALTLATSGFAISFLYYRLAYALWQTGSHEEALACYVMCSYHSFSRPDVVVREMEELVSEMATVSGGSRPTIPSPVEAREVLHRVGIAIAPTQQIRELLAALLIELVDAQIFDAAAPLVRAVATMVPYRDELFVVANSLEQ